MFLLLQKELEEKFIILTVVCPLHVGEPLAAHWEGCRGQSD